MIMKKILLFGIILAAGLLLASCGMAGGAGAVDLTDGTNLDPNLKTMLGKEIAPEAKIVRVGFIPGAKETMEMDIVSVELYESDEAEKTMIYTFYPSGMGPFSKDESRGSMNWTASAQQGAMLADIDFALVAKYVGQGIDIIENDRNCLCVGINSYSMQVDKATGEWKHDFKLENKPDEAKKAGGKPVKFTYAELKFDVVDGQAALGK